MKGTTRSKSNTMNVNVNAQKSVRKASNFSNLNNSQEYKENSEKNNNFNYT